MYTRYIIYFSALSIFISSCKNDTEDIIDPAVYDPTITFIEPADGEVLNSGDELHMEVDFNYTGNTIHHVGLLLIDEAIDDTVYEYEFHADVPDYYNLHEHYITTVTDTTEYLVVAYSSNHDDSQIVTEQVHVTVNP